MVRKGKNTVKRPVLVLHHEDRGRWNVSVFGIPDQALIVSLLTILGQQTRLKPAYARADFGPHDAQRMSQDVYGQWQPTTTDGDAPSPLILVAGLNGELYLAPDRLIYNGKTALHLAQIRKVELYEQGGLQKLNPFSEELLRIEYEQGDQHQVAGFMVRSGRHWAEALGLRLNMPIEIHEGRKKKEG